MIRTMAQRDLRARLTHLPRGPRRAVVELMRDGMPADQAIIMVTGVLSVLTEIGFGPRRGNATRVH